MIKNIGLFLAFLSTVPAANWLVQNWGTFCVPDGPCLIPVGFGLDAPSGLFAIAIGFFLRDILQDSAGKVWVTIAIAIGAAISFYISPMFAVASLVAFLVSELLDFSIYTPLRDKGRALAVAVSGVVGSIADSVLFNQLAFGSQDHTLGQILGKVYVTLVLAVVYFVYEWFKGRNTEVTRPSTISFIK